MALPTGTITFLLTDVEGSTRLWEQQPQATRAALMRHDELIEELTEKQGGQVVRPRGEGDSRFCVFARASDAVAAAVSVQRALHCEEWRDGVAIKVRMALHTGEADLRDGDYYGAAVNRCARIRGVAHGGQILLSNATAGLTRGSLPAGVAVRPLGEQRLRDLGEPEPLFQVVAAMLADDFPPLRSLDALPNNLPLQLTSFVGRERELADVKELLGRSRFVTITGTGGAGKTRLALQVAAETLDAYPDGAWFVDLAPISDPTLVSPAVVAALGLREVPGRTHPQLLMEHLEGHTTLLLLDNCEHLLDVCARLADALLHSCQHLRILATSREMLGVAG